MLNPKILFVFFVSLAFCSEDEKYTFQYKFDYGEHGTEYIERWKHEQEWSFDVPGIGYVKYASSYISLSQYLGQVGGFYKFKSTVTDMESNNSVNNINLKDYYREAMEGRSCYIYVKIDGNGLIDHIVPVDPEDDYLQEAYRAAYMNMYPINLRYPFGYKAVNVAVGDRWMVDYHKSTFYVNMGSPPSQAMSKTTWTLKKVKNKKGKKIALIEMQDSLILDLQISVDFFGERRLLTGQATGVSDYIYNWDIDSGEILKTNAVTNLTGNFEMDGKNFYMKISMRNISKKVH